MSIKSLLITSLLLFNTLYSATDFTHPLSIAELVDIAMQNHPATKQAWWNAQRATSLLGSAKSAYYPAIGLASKVNHGRDFKFINGPDTTYTIIGSDLTLAMMLYDFGERGAAVDAAYMNLLAANWQGDWKIQKVLAGVFENAYATMHAQEVLAAAKISVEEAEKVLKAARELNRTGLTPVSDVYTTQATLAQMKMEHTLQKAQLDIQRAKLAASLGLSADVQLELATCVQILPEPQKQASALIELALQQRADLLAQQSRLSESFSRLDKARAGYGPKVSLYGSGGFNQALHDDRAKGGQYLVSLNLEIPLFNGFATVYENRVAYADTKLSMEDLAELQLTIGLEVLTYSRSLEACQEMLPDAEDNLKNSTKAYESVLEKYRAGKERIAEVSNAQRQVAAARVRYSDVKTRWLTSLANLAYATGTLVPMEGKWGKNP